MRLLPLHVESGVLQVRVVLVRPKPVDVVVCHSFAEHIACGSSALLDGVLPMFDPDPAVEARMLTCLPRVAMIQISLERQRDSSASRRQRFVH